MRDGFARYTFGGFIGMVFISLVILITRYIVIEGFHKPFDTVFYWLGSVLFGMLTWGLVQVFKKIESKSDQKDLESLKEVLMTKIKSEEDIKHEILATMHNISGTISGIEKKFDSRLDFFGQQLMEHIQVDNNQLKQHENSK
jgi:amino acid permease